MTRPARAAPAEWTPRVGLLVDKKNVRHWAYKMIERIIADQCGEICVVIVNDTENEQKRSWGEKIQRHGWRSISNGINRILKRIQTTLMERSKVTPDAFSQKNLDDLLPGVATVHVNPRRTKHSDWIEGEDLVEIKKHQPDILIRLGFRILRGKILSLPRYGVWSFHHGDNRVNRGGPTGFWEAMGDWAETGSILQILGEDLDNGQVLYRSISCTVDHDLLLGRNRLYWKTLSFIPRQLRELQQLGPEGFFAQVKHANRHPDYYSNGLFVEPTNLELGLLLLGRIGRKFVNLINNALYENQWSLIYCFGIEKSTALWRYKQLVPPRDKFWADPHVVHDNGRYFVFFEEFANGKGHVSCAELTPNGFAAEPEIVLITDYHLSNPLVFEEAGTYYMLPETKDNGTIELYRCEEFPHRWVHDTDLMTDVIAVDPTLHKQDDRWWLFVNIAENDGAASNDELFLFSANDFRATDWVPHPMNPIVSDASRARPAGRLFQSGDHLYRPSQIGVPHYGYGLSLNWVRKLTEDDYFESSIAKIEPNWHREVIGVHGLSRDGDLTVIDANFRRPRFW